MPLVCSKHDILHFFNLLYSLYELYYSHLSGGDKSIVFHVHQDSKTLTIVFKPLEGPVNDGFTL